MTAVLRFFQERRFGFDRFGAILSKRVLVRYWSKISGEAKLEILGKIPCGMVWCVWCRDASCGSVLAIQPQGSIINGTMCRRRGRTKEVWPREGCIALGTMPIPSRTSTYRELPEAEKGTCSKSTTLLSGHLPLDQPFYREPGKLTPRPESAMQDLVVRCSIMRY